MFVLRLPCCACNGGLNDCAHCLMPAYKLHRTISHHLLFLRSSGKSMFYARHSGLVVCVQDEAIVHAINEYTRALQEGLRIVGS